MEDYVTFEIAKKLKEKGFDEPCSMYYHIHDDIADCIGSLESTVDGGYDFFNSKNKYRCSAPTIHQVLKWLMDEKRIFVEVNLLSGGWSYVIKEIAPLMGYDLKTHLKYEDSWEQALLSGIRYVIDNLI